MLVSMHTNSSRTSSRIPTQTVSHNQHHTSRSKATEYLAGSGGSDHDSTNHGSTAFVTQGADQNKNNNGIKSESNKIGIEFDSTCTLPKSVEPLSDVLGIPDIYAVSTKDMKVRSEWLFTGQLAEEGYRDETIRLHGADDFFRKLDERQEILRETWKSVSTMKTREERRAMFQNAVKSCECISPKVITPSLIFTDKERWINGLAGSTPLRELASSVPHGYRLKSIIDTVISYNVPISRAVWFIKLLCINQTKEKVSFSQNWTDFVILCLDAMYKRFSSSPTPSSSFSSSSSANIIQKQKKDLDIILIPNDTRYILSLISFCYEEGLIENDMLEQWLIKKIDQISEKQNNIGLLNSHSTEFVGSKENRGHSTDSQSSSNSVLSSSSYLEAYFSSPIVLASLDVSQFINKITNFISKHLNGNVHCSEILNYIARIIVNKSNFSSSIPRFLQSLHKKNMKGSLMKELFNPVVCEKFSHIIPSSFVYHSLDTFLDHGSAERIISSISKFKDQEIIQVIFEWTCTSDRDCQTKPYIAALITYKLHELRMNQNEYKGPHPLQEVLFNFLRKASKISSPLIKSYLLRLYSELLRLNIFSHENYVELCIAHGFISDQDSKEIIKQLPIFNEESQRHTLNQRNIVLYGATYKNNRLYREEFEEIEKIKVDMIETITCTNSNQMDSAVSLLSKEGLTYFARYMISDHIKKFIVKNFVRVAGDPDLFEIWISRAVTIFECLGDYNSIIDILEYSFESMSGLNSLIYIMAFCYQEIFISTNRAKQLMKMLLDKCQLTNLKHNSGKMTTPISSFAEHILKQMSTRHSEIFKFTSMKRDFPTLSSALDAISTPSSQTYKNSDLMSGGEKLPTRISSIFSNFNGSLNNVENIVHEVKQEKLLGQSRKQVLLVLKFIFEQFDVSFKNNSYSSACNQVVLLRELYVHSVFSCTEFCDTLSYMVFDRLKSANTQDIISIYMFLMISVIRGLITYDTISDNIMESVITLFSKTFNNKSSSFSQGFLRFLKTFLLQNSENDPDVVDHSNFIPLNEFKLFQNRKRVYSVKSIYKIIRNLSSFCQKTANSAPELTELVVNFLQSYLCEKDCVIDRIIAREDTLYALLNEFMKIPSDKRFRSKTIETFFAAMYSRYNMKFDIDFYQPSQSAIDQVIQFIWKSLSSDQSRYALWLHSYLLYCYLYCLRRKEQLTIDVVSKVVQPLMGYTSNDPSLPAVPMASNTFSGNSESQNCDSSSGFATSVSSTLTSLFSFIPAMNDQYFLYGDIITILSSKYYPELKQKIVDKFNVLLHVSILTPSASTPTSVVPNRSFPSPSTPGSGTNSSSTARINQTNTMQQQITTILSEELQDRQGNEKWLQQFLILSHVIVESSRHHIANVYESVCNNIANYINSLLKVSNSTHIMEQSGSHEKNAEFPVDKQDMNTTGVEDTDMTRTREHVSNLSPIVFARLQQRIFVCLLMLGNISPKLKSIAFSVLDTLLSLIKNRVATIPLINVESPWHLKTSRQMSSIHDLVHSLLCQLQKDPKLHNQVDVYFERRRYKQRLKLMTSNSTTSFGASIHKFMTKGEGINASRNEQSSWRVIEDFVAQCSSCSAKHGHQTPTTFGGIPVRRKPSMFAFASPQASNSETSGTRSLQQFEKTSHDRISFTLNPSSLTNNHTAQIGSDAHNQKRKRNQEIVDITTADNEIHAIKKQRKL